MRKFVRHPGTTTLNSDDSFFASAWCSLEFSEALYPINEREKFQVKINVFRKVFSPVERADHAEIQVVVIAAWNIYTTSSISVDTAVNLFVPIIFVSNRSDHMRID